MKNTVISVVIVNYRVKKELFECLESIQKSSTRVSLEVIVVDNDEEKTIEKDIEKEFPWVRYVKSPANIGFGAGNNLGAKYARGEFLFFLNPDTLIEKGAIDNLCHFLKKHDKVGVVAPLLLDKNRKPYPQGSTKLRPLEGLIALSFLNKLFPNNPISKNYLLLDWDKKKPREVDVVPGSAFIIRRDIFEKIRGFDESFFLYFEESDLCRRVKDLNYKIFIVPEARIIHFWGRSTQKFEEKNRIFVKSRFIYFKKHYGYITGLLVELYLRINKITVTFFLILVVALYFRIYKLNELMPFIPDQGWFYLSARDMIITGKIPLVGPETSHPWIHHGPLWTYTLAIILWVFNFHPITPAYFIAILGVLTVWLLYKVSSELFTKRIGLIVAFLYATSPLLILNARMPYHTSPIPFLVTLLFYAVYKWIKGNTYFFPLITFLVAILYNHELTTFIFSIPVFLFVLYGFWKKKKWSTELLSKKVIGFSVLLFLIPMVPFILHDISHGYKQTVGFLVWVLYRLVKFPLSVLSSDINSLYSAQSLTESFSYLRQLIFAQNLTISLFILCASIVFFLYLFVRNLKDKNIDHGSILFFLYLFIPILSLFLHRVPIEADVLLISPFVIILIAVFFDKLSSLRLFKMLSLLALLFISFANIRFLFATNYLTANTANNRLTVSKQLVAADSIIQIAKSRNYNLVGEGDLSFFPVFTMPYEYLLWWKGHPVAKENVDFKIVVWEKDGKIVVYEQNIKYQK